MAVIEALLAGFGVLAFLFMLLAVLAPDRPRAPQVEEDPALPYREALAAALRIQQAGEVAEADIQAKAAETNPLESDSAQSDDAP